MPLNRKLQEFQTPLCVCVYLNGPQLVFLSRVIVHHNNKVVANVPLFIAASLVALSVWHQCCDVENGCAEISPLIADTRRWVIILTIMAGVTPVLTLHDVIVPAVGELSVISVLVQPPEKDLVRVAVFQVD